MRMYDIIHKKRLGGELTEEEIRFFVKGFTEGNIPDYQASAFAMAVMFVGMTDRETTALTLAMAESGDMVDLSRFGELSVDKHSTGGVGDKTTLIVAPIVASLGAKVAKMSGRGLGHTGGTVDKLESITGYKTSLSPEEFMKQVENIGISVIGQTGNLAPCDKKLYALRDVTATVESIPLITSSIMSKKIAAGTRSIVLDVKVGSGAFMKTADEAETLGRKMVDIGKSCGRNVAALITDMDTPLGYAIGNALEVKEAVSVLRGEMKGDLRIVCEALASNMISLSLGMDISESGKRVKEAIDSGLAYNKFCEWIEAQGGDRYMVENTELFPIAEFENEIKSPVDGYVSRMDAEKIGISSVILGAGRENKNDDIDMSAGIVLKKKTGDAVREGDVIATFYTSDPSRLQPAKELFLSSLEFSKNKVERNPLIYKVIK
ncbi:MAG: pyrimidine-nucleoside phosphorylase [Ruminococcaceae bacterium]|nr:pyrimidine-nucleoside phosphorylase [Oscillospiraceae bacterium]